MGRQTEARLRGYSFLSHHLTGLIRVCPFACVGLLPYPRACVLAESTRHTVLFSYTCCSLSGTRVLPPLTESSSSLRWMGCPPSKGPCLAIPDRCVTDATLL